MVDEAIEENKGPLLVRGVAMAVRRKLQVMEEECEFGELQRLAARRTAEERAEVIK